jgi:hypothetical protein
MKKSTIFCCALVLFCLTIKAQSSDALKDSMRKVRTTKLEIARQVHGQGSLLDNNRELIFLMDSSLSYNWDNNTGLWGTTAKTRSLYEYDLTGLTKANRSYIWRSTTNEWIDFYEILYIRNQQGDITHWIYNSYDTITNAWVPIEHDSLIYNSGGKLISETWNYYNKTSGIWFTGELWKYDDTGGLIEEFYKSWDDMYVVDYGYRSSYILNTRDLPISTINQNWDITAVGWINYDRITSEYTDDTILYKQTDDYWTGTVWEINWQQIYSYANSLLSEQLMQIWDSANSIWVNYAQNIYSYNGNLETENLFQQWDEVNLAWINNSRYTSFYNADNLLTESLSEYWDGYSWINYTRTSFEYDTFGHTTLKLSQQWSDGSWINLSSISYAFNSAGSQTQYTLQNYDTSTGLVNYGSSNLYSYDKNNLNIQYIYKSWNADMNDWQNITLINNYYSEHNTSGINTIKVSNMSIFPNPATNILHVRIELPNASVMVCDLKGNVILNKKAGSEIEIIDTSCLSRGIYLLKVYDSENNLTSKFVKQ